MTKLEKLENKCLKAENDISVLHIERHREVYACLREMEQVFDSVEKEIGRLAVALLAARVKRDAEYERTQ